MSKRDNGFPYYSYHQDLNYSIHYRLSLILFTIAQKMIQP